MIERLNGSTDERKAFVACNNELEKGMYHVEYVTERFTVWSSFCS